ncbi:MAG: hypothetical protein K2K76_01215 [Muribaculaceae bacterium]|nr:hypothetical protein [Muribaculaceae bacterium]
MERRLREIYSRYNKELKPLITEQELRMSAFEEPLLLNLSKMFDFLSQAQSNSKDRNSILDEMNSILSVCISQSYMYVATAIKEDIKQFEKENGNTVIAKFNNGIFVGEFESLKKEIRTIDKRCKKNKNDYLANFKAYKESYEKCRQLDAKIEAVKDTETLLHKSTGSWIWTGVGWLTSIYASLWAGKYAVASFIRIFGE